MQLAVTETSMVAEARRTAAAMASRLGMSEAVAGSVAVVVTELCTNLLKHAPGGRVLLSYNHGALDIVAEDRGPGMDVEACFRDGYSTAGSPGTGLGAVSRMSSACDVFSSPGHGTIVWARFGDSGVNFDSGAVTLPVTGETVCGDGWAIRETENGAAVVAVDGLGHGPLAASAANEAVAVFTTGQWRGAEAALDDIHVALRATRGAAVAVAEIDRAASTVAYAAMGNISSGIAAGSGPVRHLVSQNGTAGVGARRSRPFSYPWTRGSSLILCSDGLSTHWSTDALPGLISRAPAVVAAGLHREFSRGRDDATVVVVRER